MNSKNTENRHLQKLDEQTPLIGNFISDEEPIIICIYGAKNSGKTSLRNKIITAKKNDDSSNGLYNFSIKEKEMKIAESEKTLNTTFKSSHKVHASIIIVLFDLSTALDPKSIKKLKRKIENDNGCSLIRCVGTKADLLPDIQGLAKKLANQHQEITKLLHLKTGSTTSSGILAPFLYETIGDYENNKRLELILEDNGL